MMASKLHQLIGLVIFVLSIGQSSSLQEFGADEINAWIDFKRQFNKSYPSPQEEIRRQRIFIDNKRYVDSFNTKDSQESGFVQGINPLFDLTTDEINESRNGFRAPADVGDEFSGNALIEQLLTTLNETIEDAADMGEKDRAWYDNLLTLPSLDYRLFGIVSRVKDQGACGSCWAFATTGALESALASRGRRILLSEQNLVDCSRKYGNNGCRGGLMDSALRYVRDHGIMSAAEYPYEALDGKCRARANRVVTRVRGYMTLPRGNENLLRLALALRGPIPVAIDAGSRSFHSYKAGVYDDRSCKSNVRNLNHAVLLVGYGTERGRDYWLLKNSWGREWGDNGYIKIARNKRNLCGVASYAVVPRL